jgi:hypothetical protein
VHCFLLSVHAFHTFLFAVLTCNMHFDDDDDDDDDDYYYY